MQGGWREVVTGSSLVSISGSVRGKRCLLEDAMVDGPSLTGSSDLAEEA